MQQKRIRNDDCFKICVKITLIKKMREFINKIGQLSINYRK